MNKGGVFIISGPSGSGKDAVLGEVFKLCPEVRFSISSITREMRTNEKQGEKYNFISVEEFEQMIKEDRLLEYNCYVGNYYGTPREPVERAVNEGKDIFIEVDVNGAAKIREKIPEAVSIFIMPPSMEELKRRLSSRGTEEQEVINKRITEAVTEIGRAAEYDYIVINDVLAEAAKDVMKIVGANKLALARQKYIINEVLENVKS